MAQVVFSRNAASNVERLHRFLVEKNPEAAAHAVNVILDRLATLARFPLLGPVDPDRPDARQLFIRFGVAGYVARYRVIDDTVTVLAVRHMRQARRLIDAGLEVDALHRGTRRALAGVAALQ